VFDVYDYIWYTTGDRRRPADICAYVSEGEWPMFQIDYKSHESIYEQIINQIKDMIHKDILKEDTKLPSVRDLSKQITVNPSTVAKAFKELEREGYIYTVKGRGTFVRPRSDFKPDQKLVNEHILVILSEFKQLLYLGMDPLETKRIILSKIDELIEEGREGSL